VRKKSSVFRRKLTYEPPNPIPKVNHLDLFSGIGGFALAIDNIFYEEKNEHIFCDNEPFAQAVLKKHWPEAEIFGDITAFSPTDPTDIITGGFPCQDISNARSWTTQGEFIEQGIRGKRSGLWTEMARIIKATKPKFVVIENVPALVKKGLRTVLRDLHAIGYDAEWEIISAAYVGAPHLRKRCFVVAYPIGFGRKQESIIFSQITRQTIRQTPQWESSRTIRKEDGKKTLPESFGILDGLPRKLHDAERIKSLGNSIVPQVAMEILQAIKDTPLRRNQ